MKPAMQDDVPNSLPDSLSRLLDQPSANLEDAQLRALAAIRQQALTRHAERLAEPDTLRERLSSWLLLHALQVKRALAAAGFALVAGGGLMMVEGMLAEEEAVDIAILSHELPLESMLNPAFSGAVHD